LPAVLLARRSYGGLARRLPGGLARRLPGGLAPPSVGRVYPARLVEPGSPREIYDNNSLTR